MLGSLRQKARALTRECHALYFAARDPRTPWYVKAFAAAIAAYALSPIDLIPDFIPVLGMLDDVVLLPLAIVVVLKLIPAEVMAESRLRAAEAAARPVSRGVTVVIVLIWIGALAATAVLAYRCLGAYSGAWIFFPPL
jgi:uncharacterized membrane protein YkvA (DUF1232 family)